MRVGADKDNMQLWPFLVRPALGLAQGIVLNRLLGTDILAPLQHGNPYGVAIGVLCVTLIPAALCLAVPVLSPLLALGWAAVLGAVLAGLCAYHVWLSPQPDLQAPAFIAYALLPVCFFGVFIFQGLLVAGVRDRRLRADYTTYFDVGWSQAVQIGLGILFAVLLWAIVALGAGLFSMIGIGRVWHMVGSRWFYLPLLTLGFALAANLTAYRVQLLWASRSLFLTLAAWLSPPLTLLTAAFLLALPGTGLAPLWHTHLGGEYLIGAAFVHVVLINAVFGDGTTETAPARLLRWSAGAACVLLTPLVAIAAYGAFARIREYGLTPERIFLLADVLVAATYAAGYAGALLRSQTWLGALRGTNVAAAWLMVALILLLWSPVADPVRIAVGDQVARLQSGRTTAGQFDFRFLKGAGPYGVAALKRLQNGYSGPDAARVRVLAAAAAATNAGSLAPIEPPTPALLAAQITVHPAGARLPDGLLRQDWTGAGYLVPPCLRQAGQACDAVILDIMGQGRSQVLFLPINRFQQGVLIGEDTPEAAWRIVATAGAPIGCDGVDQALRDGQFTTGPASVQNLMVAGQIVQFAPLRSSECP